MSVVELDFRPRTDLAPVSGLWWRPDSAQAALVFGHGAGAGMRHAFMEGAAAALHVRGIATFRYQFPYVERGTFRPDSQPTLLATVRAAVAVAATHAAGLPLFAGGKSMGGRMTSLATAAAPLSLVRGLVFFGFPLHPAGAPSTARARHLADVAIPMLFLQGTRDKLAELPLLRNVVEPLGALARIHVAEGADHGFGVLKRSGRTAEDVLDEMAATAAEWMKEISR